MIATLIESCKSSNTNPHTWLTETPERLPAGHPANAVSERMPRTAVS